LTDDADLAASIKHMTTTAKRAHGDEFYHDQVGYNYRMPNINAALVYAQLEKIGDMLARKRALAAVYEDAFDGFEYGAFMGFDDDRESNYWLNAVRLEDDGGEVLKACLEFLNDHQIQARPLWRPMHQLPMYKDCPRMADLTVTERIANQIINLPSSAFLKTV